METERRKSPGSNPCEPVGSFCRIHQGSLNGDGMCRIRRAWMESMVICVICGVEESKTLALTLNRAVVTRKHDLQKPRVSGAYLATWIKVASSKPGKDGICTDCASQLSTQVQGGEGDPGRLRVREEVPGAVRTVSILMPLMSHTMPQRPPIRRPTPATVATAVAVAAPAASAPIAATPAPASEPSWTPQSALDVACAILERREGLRRADKRPRTEGKGSETQCMVAANAPRLCQSWGDWYEMRTVSMPTRDGSPPRAHFPFCSACQKVCEDGGIQFGPTLFQMITGHDPAEARRAPLSADAVRQPSHQIDSDGRRVGHTGKTERKRTSQLAKRAEREEEARKAAEARTAANAGKPSKEERRRARHGG